MSRSATSNTELMIPSQKVVKTPSPSVICSSSVSSVPEDAILADGTLIEDVVIGAEGGLYENHVDGDNLVSDQILPTGSGDKLQHATSCDNNGKIMNGNSQKTIDTTLEKLRNGVPRRSGGSSKNKGGSSSSKSKELIVKEELQSTLAQQIQLFVDEIAKIKSSGRTTNLHASLSDRLQSLDNKYCLASTDFILNGATVVLIQIILSSFTAGPLTERDLRLRVDSRCRSLGLRTASKGTPVGTSVEINSACNVLMELGILELVAPSEATTLFAETAADQSEELRSKSSIAAETLIAKLQQEWHEKIQRYFSAGPASLGMCRFESTGSIDIDGEDDEIPKLERCSASDIPFNTSHSMATTVDELDDASRAVKLERNDSGLQDGRSEEFRSRGRPHSSSSSRKSKQKSKKNVGALRIWKLRDDLRTLMEEANSFTTCTEQCENSFSSNPPVWLRTISAKHYEMNAALEVEERLIRRLAGQCEFPMAYANHRTGTSYLAEKTPCRVAYTGKELNGDSSFAIGLIGDDGDQLFGMDGMDVYNSSMKITADYLLDKVKATKRQRGTCLVRQHNQLVTNYLRDLSEKEDKNMKDSHNRKQPRVPGIYDGSYIDAARSLCRRTVERIWTGECSGSSNSSKGKVLMADYAKELTTEVRDTVDSSNFSSSNSSIQAALLMNPQFDQIDLVTRKSKTFDSHQEVNINTIRRYSIPMELEDSGTGELVENHSSDENILPCRDEDNDSVNEYERKVVYSLPDLRIVTNEIPWIDVAKEFIHLIPSTEADSGSNTASDVRFTSIPNGTQMNEGIKRSESRNSISSRASTSSRRRSSGQQNDFHTSSMKRSLSQVSTASDDRTVGAVFDYPTKKIRLYVNRPVYMAEEQSSTENSGHPEVVKVDAPHFKLITSVTERLQKCHDADDEDSISVEDISDERYAAAHDEALSRMREKWVVIKQLKSELGIGSTGSGSHLRRRTSFDFVGAVPSLSVDANNTALQSSSAHCSNNNFRSLSVDIGDDGQSSVISGPLSTLTPASTRNTSRTVRKSRRRPGRPRKR